MFFSPLRLSDLAVASAVGVAAVLVVNALVQANRDTGFESPPALKQPQPEQQGSGSLNSHPRPTKMQPYERLPYEIWLDILNDVFATRTRISNPPRVKWELSDLNRKLNVYRCLARVSKSFRVYARDMFLEEVPVEAIEALEGVLSLLKSEPKDGWHASSSIKRLRFSFYEFRCSKASPRRPRKVSSFVPEEGTSNLFEARGHWEANLNYRPKLRGRAKEWEEWHGLLSQIVESCTGLDRVQVSFGDGWESQYEFSGAPVDASGLGSKFKITDEMKADRARLPPLFTPLFAPRISKDALSNGLSSLVVLTLTNPYPWESFASAFHTLDSLSHLSIAFTEPSRLLPEPVFTMPPNLQSLKVSTRTGYGNPMSFPNFVYHDQSGNADADVESSRGWSQKLKYLWIQTSHGGCDVMMQSIANILRTHQDTLEHLTLNITLGSHTSFQPAFELTPRIRFRRLHTLLLLDGMYTSSVFKSFDAAVLQTLEVTRLDSYRQKQPTAEQWQEDLLCDSLDNLKMFSTDQMDYESSMNVRSIMRERGVAFKSSTHCASCSW